MPSLSLCEVRRYVLLSQCSELVKLKGRLTLCCFSGLINMLDFILFLLYAPTQCRDLLSCGFKTIKNNCMIQQHKYTPALACHIYDIFFARMLFRFIYERYKLFFLNESFDFHWNMKKKHALNKVFKLVLLHFQGILF